MERRSLILRRSNCFQHDPINPALAAVATPINKARISGGHFVGRTNLVATRAAL